MVCCLIFTLPSQLDRILVTVADTSVILVEEFHGRCLNVWFERVAILVEGARVDLTRRELRLLQFLVSYPNRVLDRHDILTHVWHDENDGRSRTVDVHIRRLRVKLGAAGKQIQTVPGLGYRFSEE
jgi:two-component system, OmpR family, alkaline phosphatase synthesis response regulator PhoP